MKTKTSVKNSTSARGFKALLVTQFLGAFNDNAFKLIIALLAIDIFGGLKGGTLYISIAGAIFILPFLLFSTYAGYLADRFSKKVIIIGAKVAELLIMVLGLFVFLWGNIWMMFFILFLMGAQSAFFSPSKYGILPEILNTEDISEGNGKIQFLTFLAIILGTASGGFFMGLSAAQPHQISYLFIIISLIGIVTSLFITKVSPSGSLRQIQWNFLAEVRANLKTLLKRRPIFLAIMGSVYFGLLGALFQLNILLYTRRVMQISHNGAGLLLTVVAFGIGFGSFSAGKLSDKKIEFGLVPLGALGMSVFSLCLGFTYHSFLFTLICLFFLGLSGGMYIIPLNAFIQQRSPKQERGKVLATNNFLGFSAMLLASVLLWLLREVLRLNAVQIFIFAGILTLGVTYYISTLLPKAFLRLIVFLITHSLYKTRCVGRENVPNRGGALLVCNHVSFVDPLLIVSSLQRPVQFLMSKEIYNWRLLKPLFKMMDNIPISIDDDSKDVVRAIKKAREELQAGNLVCIFAEGGITRTGHTHSFKRGLENIVQGTNIPIIPVHLDRMWGSIFSFERDKFFFKIPKKIPYPVTLSFGQTMSSDSTAFEIGNKVMEMGAEAFKYRIDDELPLPMAFWKEARTNPFRLCVADSMGKKLSYAKTLISAVALSKIIKENFSQTEIGIMLPPTVAVSVVNIAASIAQKIVVNLNYTLSNEGLKEVIKQANINTVITSKKFIEKTGIALNCEEIFVEDLVKKLSRKDKNRAIFKSFILPAFLSRTLIFGRKRNWSMDKVAAIVFSSGSTGKPKGVMLSHSNIISNVQGLYQVFHITKKDKIVGILPFFHSFGYTATFWFPILSGISAIYHLNPLEAKIVGDLTAKYRGTILLTTPTFLQSYIQRCTPKQFRSLRIVVTGAEKLRERIVHDFEEKFAVTPMEGYGCTELSPIVSFNVKDFIFYGKKRQIRQIGYKPNKIGKPIPGVAVKIVDVDTHKPLEADRDGMLLVKGPNVMLGYLNQPDKTKEVIRNGWYVTGDIANIDEDGFIAITDRLSRFSKIGGEMVPHIKVEEVIYSIIEVSGQRCAVSSVSDEQRGERLIVLYTGDLDIDLVWRKLNEQDIPKLWIPQKQSFFKIDSIPLLGSGKLDLKAVKKLAEDLAKEG